MCIRDRTRGCRGSRPRSRRRSCMGEAVRRRVKRRQFDAGGDQTSCRRSRDAAKIMYTTRRATIGHFLHHSGHGRCDDGTRSCRLHGPVHENTFEIQNVLFFKIFGTLNAKPGSFFSAVPLLWVPTEGSLCSRDLHAFWPLFLRVFRDSTA